MEEYLNTLKKVPLFSSLNEQTLKDILKITQKRKFVKGKVICCEGEPGDSMYIVLSGKAKVSLVHDYKEYILAFIEKGGFFGELSLIDGLPRSANVEAVEDCEVLAIHRGDFLRLLRQSPEISIEIMKMLSERLRSTDERVKSLAFLPVEGRILNYLVDFAQKNGVRVKNYLIIDRAPSNNEIATLCGCARETVSRVLKALKQKGVIRRNKRQYVIFPPNEVV
ncbi:MAG: Crp/Fnr family transcriptional regulator [Deltaproteobacteria bacterium]|nr:Crp/Fnr family transcriptional regulator [Deltaproteobacteria bacterium]